MVWAFVDLLVKRIVILWGTPIESQTNLPLVELVKVQ